MTDLPALSDTTKRKLAVQWDTIRDNQKLTDEDLAGYDRERQRLLSIAAKWPRNDPRHRDPRLATQRARWIGESASVRAAGARFRGIDWEYWQHWCHSGAPYEAYAAWLDSLKRDTVAELASIWNGKSDVTDRWFKGTCAPAIEKALVALVKQRIAQARDVESQRLDRVPPGNPILNEIRAGGENLSPPAGVFPKPTQDGATEPSKDESSRTDAGPAVSGTKDGTDRRKAVDAYIEDVLSQKGIRITRTDIWKQARYKSRTEFERWERNDPKNPNKTAHERFTRILTEKPHLK